MGVKDPLARLVIKMLDKGGKRGRNPSWYFGNTRITLVNGNTFQVITQGKRERSVNAWGLLEILASEVNIDIGDCFLYDQNHPIWKKLKI